jgi:hypothetical protein
MAEIRAPVRRPLRFGSFELDPASGELRKAGIVVGLQDQSLKVLVELLERPGDLVTREQLRQRLWPNGTFVDFEHGLNAVINRLREALGDSADSPASFGPFPGAAIASLRRSKVGSRHRQRCQNRRPRSSSRASVCGWRSARPASSWLSRPLRFCAKPPPWRARLQGLWRSRDWPAGRAGPRSRRMASRSRSPGPARSSTIRISMSRLWDRRAFGA